MGDPEQKQNLASQVYSEHFPPVTWFERAVFLGWYCSLGDCEFCYMSTQKSKILDPAKAVRSFSSILAEVMVCNAQGWKIEFLTGGYDTIGFDRLLELVKLVKRIYPGELWLNVGVLSREQLMQLKPYIAGVNGAAECVNEKIRRRVCPSKSLRDIEQMYADCDALGIRKSATIIIGLGETVEDMPLLAEFIRKHKIDRLTFYRLNPHKGTPFVSGPDSAYYASWISYTRIQFPILNIIAGTWADHVDEVGLLLRAGANAITKFPAIKLLGSVEAQRIENDAARAGRRFIGSMTRHQKINISGELERLGVSGTNEEYIRRTLARYDRPNKI